MSFDEMLKRAAEDIEVPESLSPENIEKMLRMADIEQLSPEDVPELTVSDTLSRKITMSRPKRSVIVRTAAAAAAFIALAGGFAAINANISHIDDIESRKEYRAVQVHSYGELYDIYTGLYEYTPEETAVKDSAAYGDGVEILTDDTEVTTVTEPVQTQPAVTAPVPQETRAAREEETAPPVKSDFSDADIVKSVGNRIYYLCGTTLYEVDKTDMTYVSEVASKCEPTEMYVTDSTLTLIGGTGSTSAEIYDISEGTPVLLHSYTISGRHIAARTEGGDILIVTDLSDNNQGASSDISSYVPSYTVDGEKKYIEAQNIFVPRAAGTTSYIIAAAAGRDGISAKAVLGCSPDIFISDSTLYVTGISSEDGRDVTYLTAFNLNGDLSYKSTAHLDGRVIPGSMAESGGMFRMAAADDDGTGVRFTNIYSLNSDLNVVNTAYRLLPGEDVTVRYEDNYAILSDGTTVDLDRSEQTEDALSAPDTVALTDSVSVGVTQTEDGLVLSAYENGALADSYLVTAGYSMTDAVTDKNAILTDAGHMIIGLPVTTESHHYYIFTYGENGLDKAFSIDSEDNPFERAMIDENRLIVIGRSGMMTIDLDTMQAEAQTPLEYPENDITE